jgi:hypothetical protein
MLTGNRIADLAICMRLHHHELAFMARAIADGRVAAAEHSRGAAARYLWMAEGLR